MVDLAAACDMFSVENAEHLWPHCHRSVEGVKVDQIKICWLDADLLLSRFEELFGLGALLRGAVFDIYLIFDIYLTFFLRRDAQRQNPSLLTIPDLASLHRECIIQLRVYPL